MKNLSLTFCLVIAALFGSVGSVFASDLPDCTFLVWKYDPNFTEAQNAALSEAGAKTLNYNYCFGIRDYKNGIKYVGEWKDFKAHGTGTVTYSAPNRHAGYKYVGEWRNNYQHGQGTATFADGTKYVGAYKNDKRHGQGALIFANGQIEEGIWKDGVYQGASELSPSVPVLKAPTQEDEIVSTSDLLDCPLLGNVFHNCFAYHIFGDHNFYKGEWKDGKMHGQGEYIFTNGDKYVGEFRNGKKNGHGIKTFVNGLIKEGIWRDGEFQYAKKLSPPVPVAKTPTQDDDTYKVASGSGFYVSDAGHIITNHHVIEGCEDMKVHSKGNVLETKKISEDRRNDLALLKTSETPKHSFSLSTESPFPLQDIVVAGYPFGEKVSSTLKFTQGIVSSIAGLENDYSQIQIDAAIQPGNSGGPILDEYGNVVAVAVAKLSLKKILKDYGVVPENTNFGVKASAVRNLMEGNGVSFKSPNTEVISKRELSQIATDGTVYLTCWMTTAQIEQMRARKVLFEDLE